MDRFVRFLVFFTFYTIQTNTMFEDICTTLFRRHDVYENYKPIQLSKITTTYNAHISIETTVPLLLEMLDYVPSFGIEVGSFIGNSTVVLGNMLRTNANGSVLICIDTWCGDTGTWFTDEFNVNSDVLYHYFMNNIIANSLTNTVIPLRMCSVVAARMLKLLIHEIDFVYIDCINEPVVSITELTLYHDILKDRGVLFGYGYDLYPSLKRDIDLLCETHNYELKLSGHLWFIKKQQQFGFIVLRSAHRLEHDLIWRECFTCIRKQYTDVPVVIIDDHSCMRIDDDFVDSHTTIQHSEFQQGCGELLPYYYFHKNKYFKKAIIIHDSLFLQKQFKKEILDSIDTVRFLWKFYEYYERYPGSCDDIKEMSCKIGLPEWLYDRPEWQIHGCFGVMSIISWNFLDSLVTKYPLFTHMSLIITRENRMLMERIFAMMCFMYLNGNVPESIFGLASDMPNGFFLTYYRYSKHKNILSKKYTAIKVFSGR